jgi:prephenate dehydratase
MTGESFSALASSRQKTASESSHYITSLLRMFILYAQSGGEAFLQLRLSPKESLMALASARAAG